MHYNKRHEWDYDKYRDNNWDHYNPAADILLDCQLTFLYAINKYINERF
jgi:hypothetical protein